MNYKTTRLTAAVQCTTPVIGEFQNLLFGAAENMPRVFDATAYMENFDSADFSRRCMPAIEARARETGLDTNTLFYANTDGHTLVNAALTYTFLQYATPALTVYFESIVDDCLQNGAAFSDAFIAHLAADRLSDETMAKISEERGTKGFTF